MISVDKKPGADLLTFFLIMCVLFLAYLTVGSTRWLHTDFLLESDLHVEIVCWIPSVGKRFGFTREQNCDFVEVDETLHQLDGQLWNINNKY